VTDRQTDRQRGPFTLHIHCPLNSFWSYRKLSVCNALRCGLMRPMITYSGMVCRSVCLSRGCAVQTRLNGLRSCLGWRLLIPHGEVFNYTPLLWPFVNKLLSCLSGWVFVEQPISVYRGWVRGCQGSGGHRRMTTSGKVRYWTRSLTRAIARRRGCLVWGDMWLRDCHASVCEVSAITSTTRMMMTMIR